MKEELKFLEHILKRIERKKGWKPFTEWSNFEFQILSDDISESSGTNISRTTIRNIVEKIINKDEQYQPQSATKDALIEYSGYKIQNIKSIKKSPLFKRVGIIVFSLIIISLFTLFILKPEYFVYSEKKYDFTFEVENPIGTIPHTVYCNYDLSHVKSEDVKIDFGHVSGNGDYLFFTLKKTNNIISQCYHFPGTYFITLYIDGTPQKKQQITVYTNDWFVSVMNEK